MPPFHDYVEVRQPVVELAGRFQKALLDRGRPAQPVQNQAQVARVLGQEVVAEIGWLSSARRSPTAERPFTVDPDSVEPLAEVGDLREGVRILQLRKNRLPAIQVTHRQYSADALLRVQGAHAALVVVVQVQAARGRVFANELGVHLKLMVLLFDGEAVAEVTRRAVDFRAD